MPARAFDLTRRAQRKNRDYRGNEQQRAGKISHGKAALIDQKSAHRGADKKARLQNHGVDNHRIHQQRRRNQAWNQRGARRPVKDFDERADQAERVNMPDLNRAGEGQDPKQQIGYELKGDRCYQQLFAVEGIGNGAGK